MRAAELHGLSIAGLALFIGACWPELTLSEPTSTDADTPTETEETDTSAAAGEENPCYDKRCVTPPADGCSPEGDAVIRYARNGWCEADDKKAVCRYETYEETCAENGCSADEETEIAGCKDTPSSAAYCFSPPFPECVGDDLRIPYPDGIATADGCDYPIRTVRCEAGCDAAAGACKEDPCFGKICADPPAPFCEGDLLIRWAPFGRCADDGECVYIKEVVPCDDGCSEAACREEDRCSNIVCNTPPSTFCLDEKTLFVYEARGACDNGACIYSGASVLCDGDCEEGRCTDDPCLGVHCNFPTAPSCTADGTLRIWDGAPFADEVPLCRDGVCLYNTDDVNCGESGCSDGRCRSDACAGMQLYCSDINTPAPYCAAQGAVTYETIGACKGGGYCEYSQGTTPCEEDCNLGQCEEETAD